ncbi:MAG: tetratricopeptide repeat protein [Planctomycetota bacterium]|nr:tetratricopeptide repeat protein [Planctomycetota bacterium]
MNAMISGRAGLAIITDERPFRSLWLDEAGGVGERVVADPGTYLREVDDLEFLRDVSIAQVEAHLLRRRNCEDAIQMVLVLLDGGLSVAVRREAAEVLDELFGDGSVAEGVERILYAAALPRSADVEGATAVCKEASLKRAGGFVAKLLERQPFIMEVRLAWDELAASQEDREQTKGLEMALISEGFFRRLVESLATEDHLDSLMFAALSNERVKEHRDYRSLLQRWVDQWKEAIANVRMPARQECLSDVSDDTYSRQRNRRRRTGADEALARVDRTKAFIVRAMRRQRVVDALRYVDQLVADQEDRSEDSHICMTLCSLASEAKGLGLLDMQIELLSRACKYSEDDPVLLCQQADALKIRGRLPEALAAYEEIMAKDPENVVAKTGRAEVLKALNRLPEALAAYEEVMTKHPENVFAKNGRAEVLKALNRLPEALAAYEEVMTKHPENVVAKNGRAEVLKALNRLPEALAAYEEIMTKHPEDVVAKNGRAEVLKALNRLPEALAAYEEIMTKHPENVVAKTGTAGVLAAMDRWKEALALLPHADPVTEEDWIACHIRGMILLRRGEREEAAKIFEYGVAHTPRPVQRAYFQTALAVCRMRERQYKEATEILDKVTLPIFQTCANVLRLHAFGEQGDCERTARLYEALPKEPEPILRDLQSELHRRYVLFEAPHHDEQWLQDREIDYLLLAA